MPVTRSLPRSLGARAQKRQAYVFRVSSSERGFVTAVLTALLLITADMSIVSTLLPQIGEALGGSAHAPWLVSVFMAAMAFSGVSAGALADRHGQTRVLSGALGVYALAAALAALAPSMAMLIAARALEGVGGGAIIVLSYAAIAAAYGNARHAAAQSVISLTWGCAALLGPIAGLALARGLGFCAVFAVKVPICLLCIAALRRQRAPRAPLRAARLDLPAQAAFGVLVLSLMFALSALRLHGAHTAWLAAGSVGAMAAVLLTVRIVRRPASAPIPLAFLTDRHLSVYTFLVPCASGALYAAVTYVPLAVAASGATDAKLTLPIMAAALGFVAASSLSGWLTRAFGFRAVTVAGLACIAAGHGGLGLGVAMLAAWQVALATCAVGMGLGVVAVTSVVYAQHVAPAGYLATYTSAVQVLRNIGAAVGICAFPLLQRAGLASARDPSSAGFVSLALLLAGGAVLALGLPRQPPAEATRASHGEGSNMKDMAAQ